MVRQLLSGVLDRDLGSAARTVVLAAAIAPPVLLLAGLVLAGVRLRARRARRYGRFEIEIYRADRASAEALVAMLAALHKRLLRRWWQRLVTGQPGVALEIHFAPASAGAGGRAWFAVSVPVGSERFVAATLRGAYPNCRLRRAPAVPPPAVLSRLKKHARFIRRARHLDPLTFERSPPVDRLLTMLGACGEPALVQLALTPAPALFERVAREAFRHREAEIARRRSRAVVRDRSLVDDAELRGGLDLQHRPLFFADIRVGAGTRAACEQIASELRAETAENRLVERRISLRRSRRSYAGRVARGEGNPLPGPRSLFAPGELAALWHLPSTDYAAVPVPRDAAPWAPAPPGVYRPDGPGLLRDVHGAVSIHPEMRRQNVAAPGTVEQGKTSFLVATVAEDLRRERCAVIVVDPKGDAAEAAISCVPPGRTCTVLDFARPACGFNPLAVDAPADVIADYVVGALKLLFSDADVRASSDRYLRNAIIAVLACDRGASLWDAARLLSVGEEGYAYRREVGARVRALPEFSEISAFFTAELTAQLADSRSTTTAKLDAPVNKLARLLNSASIKRVLLNRSLAVDFDAIIAGGEVLVVKGALGAMGAGNTAVLMQLLMGMLDAALARQQDLVPAAERRAVALKVDEAPLVINRGFAQTIALKRSAGLETVACWQTDAQWVEPELRDQLDALFAHRVYFATASARDARAAVALAMTEFSDTVRPGIAHLSALGSPAVRLHLPRHHAIVSLTTPAGRQQAFVAQTLPMRVDPERIALHAARQARRGGRYLEDLSQPNWQRAAPAASASVPATAAPADTLCGDPAAPSPDGYAELVGIDRARSVRVARGPEPLRRHVPDALDLAILELIARCGHVLSSQIHRHLNPGRAITTTQRRLKRLADAGLVARLQFHGRDGAGAPMCCMATATALDLLAGEGIDPGRGDADGDAPPAHARAADRLRAARREVHVAGWALALVRLAAAAGSDARLRGPAESVLSPPSLGVGDRSAALRPADLRLGGGRVAHEFLRTAPDGARKEAERFETVRPGATVSADGIDVLVELELRPAGAVTAKLERYDHFLSGWSLHTRRYGARAQAQPFVVFVCRDSARARAVARAADLLLCASRAYAGERPEHWEYPGRERMLFASEADLHRGVAAAVGVPRLPPSVRAQAADDAGTEAGAGAAAATVLQAVLPLARWSGAARREGRRVSPGPGRRPRPRSTTASPRRAPASA